MQVTDWSSSVCGHTGAQKRKLPVFFSPHMFWHVFLGNARCSACRVYTAVSSRRILFKNTEKQLLIFSTALWVTLLNLPVVFPESQAPLSLLLFLSHLDVSVSLCCPSQQDSHPLARPDLTEFLSINECTQKGSQMYLSMYVQKKCFSVHTKIIIAAYKCKRKVHI